MTKDCINSLLHGSTDNAIRLFRHLSTTALVST